LDARRRHVDAENRQGQRVAIQLLESLMPLLLHFGVTCDQISVAARKVLVLNAARVARLRNGRVNQSQIAASTGLSRSEVRKLLVIRDLDSEQLRASRPKTTRVVEGWLTDKRFRTAAGRPRALKVSGSGATFEHLVRTYGRDVPARAMAAELERQGRVSIKNDRIELLRNGRSKNDRRRLALGDQLEVLGVLAEFMSTTPIKSATQSVQFICIPARDELEQKAIRQRVDDVVRGASAALLALKRSSIVDGPANGRRRSKGVRVAFVVSGGVAKVEKTH